MDKQTKKFQQAAAAMRPKVPGPVRLKAATAANPNKWRSVVIDPSAPMAATFAEALRMAGPGGVVRINPCSMHKLFCCPSGSGVNQVTAGGR